MSSRKFCKIPANICGITLLESEDITWLHLGYHNWICGILQKKFNVLQEKEYQGKIVYGEKVKCTLVQVLRLCTGRTVNRGITLLFLDHGTRRGEGSVSRSGRSLPPGKNRYPLYKRLGGPQGRSGHVRKISPPTWFDSMTVQPEASRYPAH